MIGAEVPLLDQGSVQFILLGVMILAVLLPDLDHDREVARSQDRDARYATWSAPRGLALDLGSVAFRCS